LNYSTISLKKSFDVTSYILYLLLIFSASSSYLFSQYLFDYLSLQLASIAALCE
jgi:hypothetical protein